jgi:tRNA-specific 2-thiouridylase
MIELPGEIVAMTAHSSSKGKVMVGLSGGVDSSVAALRLLDQGWDVEGLFMKNWEEDDQDDYCAAAEDLADAQAVADLLGIELHTVNFSSEYWDRVFTHFLEEYKAGRTPNPDVLCNREIKFKAFLEHALDLGADFIATGHYAGVTCEANICQLLLATDQEKDQTYFLYMLGQPALRHSLFPLSDLRKQQVRELAAQAGFPNHKKKDSTGICFIGERRFRDFLSDYLPANPGEIQTIEGRRIGQHQGLMYYTLGQRQGLGIGGMPDAPDAPWFVMDKDLEHNALIVAQGHDHPLLLSTSLVAEQLHWVAGSAPANRFSCQARCRHRQPLQECEVVLEGQGMQVLFRKPQRAVTPGQSVVFYSDGACLGGGIIVSRAQ